MPDKQQYVQELKVAQIMEKTYTRKSGPNAGSEGKLWNVRFQGGGFPSSTFSKTAAAEAEKLVDKPARFTLQDAKTEGFYDIVRIDSTDGKVIYEPGMDKPPYRGGGGGGGKSTPDWGFKDPEERHEDRKSIEGQVAVKAAVEILGDVIQYGEDITSADDALSFVEKAAERLTKVIRKAATDKSGLGSRPSHRSEVGGVGGPAGSSGPTQSAGAAGNTPAGDTAPGPALPPGQDRPSPGPDVSAVFSQALEFFGGDQVELQKAYKAHFNKPPNIAVMTDVELQELMGAGVSA